ncbi:MAG: ribonuclease III [Candidatus Paceibacterota bacterium]|jgi:ribonuclease-3
MNLSEFQEKIDVSFKNEELLKEALTHRSYLNENPSWGISHNERLEFLGDAVLEMIITEKLFASYPDKDEGYLTSVRAALVNYIFLSEAGKGINLGDFLSMSKGESKDIGKARDVILANAFEALIGAIYLDSGYETSARFIEKYVFSKASEVIEKGSYRDAKSFFQEIAQEKYKITPNYQVLEESGPDHKKIFKVGVFIGEEELAQGEGFSKQEAEVEAAKKALSYVSKAS